MILAVVTDTIKILLLADNQRLLPTQLYWWEGLWE